MTTYSQSQQRSSLYTVFFANDIDDVPLWSIQLNDIELVAGILAGGSGIMDDLNYETKGVTYYIDSDADVSDFRLVDSIPEEEIPKNTCGRIACSNGICNVLGCPEPGQYGLWMNSGKRFYYSLYAFRKASFFQGRYNYCM